MAANEEVMMAEDKPGGNVPDTLPAEEKKQIRHRVLARRDALTGQEQRRASCLITERLLGHQWFYRAGSLLCYVSYGSELDTRELIREALRLGKEVYVPRVGEGRQMDFYRIGALEELQPGFHGILEPPDTARIYAGKRAERALMLMPGVAFDLYGNRLGYGGGYYDRYLAVHPQFQTRLDPQGAVYADIVDDAQRYVGQAYTMAIGHVCQLVEEPLPVEETDCRPCQVILV